MRGMEVHRADASPLPIGKCGDGRMNKASGRRPPLTLMELPGQLHVPDVFPSVTVVTDQPRQPRTYLLGGKRR